MGIHYKLLHPQSTKYLNPAAKTMVTIMAGKERQQIKIIISL